MKSYIYIKKQTVKPKSKSSKSMTVLCDYQQTKELISTWKTSYKHSNKGLSQL